MKAKHSTKFPGNLARYQDALEASMIDYVKVSLGEVSTNLGLTQSKVGGYPYFPKNEPYPHSHHNEPLILLAQINFSEMPGLEEFPDTGILQFFVEGSADNQEQEDHRVYYHPEVNLEQALSDFGFLDDYYINGDMYVLESLQPGEAYPISFELTCAFPGPTAPEFDAKIAEFESKKTEVEPDDVINFKVDLEDAEYEWLDHLLGESQLHQVGGYPCFIQPDPRGREFQDYMLLFQLDSDGGLDEEDDTGYKVVWGDAGIANFFILKEDFKKRDFSRVLFEWSCA